MKLNDRKMTDFLSLPAEEAGKTIEAMKQAEQSGDIKALCWAARRLIWLDEVSETASGDDEFYRAHLFNKAWADMQKTDPAPESIAGIIATIDTDEALDKPAAADAEGSYKNSGGQEIKQPIIGDDIIAAFKDSFIKKHGNENKEIEGINMWPAAGIEETYRKAAAEIGGENEAEALKTFYAEMVRFLRTATRTDGNIEEEEFILALLEGID
jgi:hypothetical protein